MGRLSDSIDSIWFVKLDTTKVCSTMTCDMCKYSTYVHDYSCIQWPPMLVGGLEHVLFSIIYRIILPLIFFKMVKTTNQYDILGITCLVVSNSVGFQGAEPPRTPMRRMSLPRLRSCRCRAVGAGLESSMDILDESWDLELVDESWK